MGLAQGYQTQGWDLVGWVLVMWGLVMGVWMEGWLAKESLT